MAIVDFQSLDTRCVVGTQTLTAQFDECIGSDDYLSESGIVAHKGSLTLTEIPGGLGLDDWAGITWLKIGTPITLEINIAGTWYRHPRGALRIMGTNYKDGVQSLEVACILGARAFSEPTDELAITTTNARAIVDQLFTLAGCGTPNWNTSANFELGDRPRLSGSYVESAGKLLASMGCFAWCDGNEVVQIHPLESATVLLTLDEAELGDGLERVLVGKPPSSVAKVSGSYAERGDRGTSNTSVVTTFGNVGAIVPDAGGYGPVSRTAITESISAEDSTVVLTTQEDRLGFQVYKGKNGLPRASLTPYQFTINTKTYSPGPDAKLLEIVESVLAPTYPTLQGFCDWAIANKFGVSLSNQMSARQSRTRFTYSDKEELIEVATEVIGPIGKPLSSLSGVDWEKVQSAYGVPSDPILVERQLTQYQQVAPGEWRKIEIREYSQVQDSDSQTGLQERLGEATADGDILQIYRDAAACSASESKITTSTSGQANPPAPERFPGTKGEAKQHQESIPYQGFATDWADKEQAYTVPYCPSVSPGDPPPRDHIRGYGERWHGAAIARWRSGRIEIPVSTALLAYRPYARVQIATPTGTYLMAMNGTSWAIAPDRCLVSSDCSLLGQIVNGQLVPPFMPIPDARLALRFRLAVEAVEPEVQDVEAVLRLRFRMPVETLDSALMRVRFRLPVESLDSALMRLRFRLPVVDTTGGFSTEIAALSGASLPVLREGSQDDGNYLIPDIGFDFFAFGTNYRSSLYASSNSYITFGFGSSAYSGLTSTNPGRGLFIEAGDRRWIRLRGGSLAANSYMVRWEGWPTTSESGGNWIWEVTFFADGAIQLVVNAGPNPSGALSMLTNGNAPTPTTTPFTYAPSTSWVFLPNGGGGYTVQTGSYS
jgi:hypothetical protein